MIPSVIAVVAHALQSYCCSALRDGTVQRCHLHGGLIGVARKRKPFWEDVSICEPRPGIVRVVVVVVMLSSVIAPCIYPVPCTRTEILQRLVGCLLMPPHRKCKPTLTLTSSLDIDLRGNRRCAVSAFKLCNEAIVPY